MTDTQVEFSPSAKIVETLVCLADLIEQPADSPMHLTDEQVSILTLPPAQVITRNRGVFADLLRRRATMMRLIEAQHGDEFGAPEPAARAKAG
ncbi:MAG TPA: hypothetical protein VGI64_09410 [Streptosporangiaceae bacterium]